MNTKKEKYVPGTYVKKRPDAAQMIDHYIRDREQRLSKIKQKEAQEILKKADKEQRDFFKKAFGKKEASPYEFDLVVNCDYITEPQGAAEIVARAYSEKFKFLIVT